LIELTKTGEHIYSLRIKEADTMRLMQVKKYNGEIAMPKYLANAHQCPRSMFLFMLQDNKGYSTEPRRRGWVAFDDRRAVYGRNIDEARTKYAEAYGL
jgi:hypothetical protein